jgi:hypothetical protein
MSRHIYDLEKLMDTDFAKDALNDDIKKLAEQMQAIHTNAVIAYTPAVNELIRRQSRNQKEIEWMLDHLLDFAGDERILNLYRKLCRYYLPINPHAFADYIQFYKEQYDEDEELFKSGYFRKNPITYHKT